MPVEEKLTGWIELVSATKVANLSEIQAFFVKMISEDPAFVGAIVTEDGAITKAEFTYYGKEPPNFAALFKPVVELLEDQEYMFFEEKVTAEHRTRSLRALLLSSVGVFKAEQDALILLLALRNEKLQAAEKDMELDSDDEEEFDEEEFDDQEV